MKARGFIRALQALESDLDHLVLTGGWAWYLYRKYLTGELSLPGEFTLDVDVVIPRRLPAGTARLDVLLANAHFDEDIGGDDHPPVTRYVWPSVERSEALVEFLTPARGRGSDATLEVGGIVAQQLRFLDLLLYDPLKLQVLERDEPESFEGEVPVPRVGLFIWQKALTFPRRHNREKRKKDLFYIFDLADPTRQLQSRIREDVRDYVDRSGPAWIDKAAKNLHAECGDSESSGVRQILEQIPQEQRPLKRYVVDTFRELIEVLRGARNKT